nr:Nucleoside-diphosphate-sugar epimerase [Salmonella sp. NCTC 7297]
MKKVAIVGLGWLGMPLAMSLAARGWQVTGSKTTLDGVEAARMSGIESYPLRLEPELVCEADDLDALLDVDALVITLPARRSGPGEDFYLQAMQELVDSRAGLSYPAYYFYQFDVCLRRCARRSEREYAASSCNGQRAYAEGTGRLAAQICRARQWTFCGWRD